MKTPGASEKPGQRKATAEKTAQRTTKSTGKSVANRTGATASSSTTAPRPSGVRIVQRPTRNDHVFEIRDAEKVYRAALVHEDVLARKNVTRESLDAFAHQIELAKEVEDLGGRISLDGARSTVKDLVGDYRAAAEIASTPMTGYDAKLAAALHVDVPFPKDDAALESYVGELAAPLAAHADLLAQCDFTTAEQAALTNAIAQFVTARKARPEETAQLRADSARRAGILVGLRQMTTSVRTAAIKAFGRSPLRVAFDRPTPAESPAATLDARAQKLLKQAGRLRAQADKLTAQAQKIQARVQKTAEAKSQAKAKRTSRSK